MHLSLHAVHYTVLYLAVVVGLAITVLFLIQRRSSEIRQSIVQRYEEMHAVLNEDLRITLSHLDVEEKAAASALETLMERNGSLIQEIEQDLSTLDEALDQTLTETNIMVTKKPGNIFSLRIIPSWFIYFYFSSLFYQPWSIKTWRPWAGIESIYD